MKRKAALHRCSERGQGIAEYLIIVILIAIGVIIGIRYFGSSVTNQFESATGEIIDLKKGDVAQVSDAPSADSSDSLREQRQSTGGVSSPGSSTSAGGGKAGSSSDDDKVIESIELDWKTLALIGIVVCAIGVALVLRSNREKGDRKQKKAKKRFSLFPKKKGGSESGQAMAEFVLVSITFFFIVLGIIQLAMILNAYSLVRYAAYNSARAAIVHGGNSEKMQEAARISLLAIYPRHGRADHIRGMVENYLGAKATDNNAAFHTYLVTIGGFPYFFSEPITETKILEGRDRSSGDVVTFDDPSDADKSVVTVEVTHRYEMVIPLVNRILFYVYNQFRSTETFGSGYSGESLDKLSADTNRMRREGDLYSQVEYRIPLVAHYTMRLQSDYVVP